MKEANTRYGTPDLIGNTSIRGIWLPYTVALLDIGTQMQYFHQQKRRKEDKTVQLKHVEHLLPLLLFPLMECWVEWQKRLAQSISGQTTGANHVKSFLCNTSSSKSLLALSLHQLEKWMMVQGHWQNYQNLIKFF